jgi:hypothetical protein
VRATIIRNAATRNLVFVIVSITPMAITVNNVLADFMEMHWKARRIRAKVAVVQEEAHVLWMAIKSTAPNVHLERLVKSKYQ